MAQELTLQVHEMLNAPEYPDEARAYLHRAPQPGTYQCPLCRIPVDFRDFADARQSKALIETAHLNPTATYIHTPENVRLAHRFCNIAQGDRSIDEFTNWIRGILERAGYTVQPPPVT